jgi:hypothetical protein
MTAASLNFYLGTIVVPYVRFLRITRQDPGLMIYLAMDNHGTHNTAVILQEMSGIGIQPIRLPAHSSHFLQPLDLTVFATFKRNCMNTKAIATKPKIEGKIVRALRAWHSSAYIQSICNGWKAGGVGVRGLLGDDAIPYIKPDRITQLVQGNCSDAVIPGVTPEQQE